MIVLEPGNEIPNITAIYVWVSVDENGEGIMGVNGMPAVFAQERLLAPMEMMMRKVHSTTKKPLRLVKFTTREVVKTIGTQ